MGSDVVTYDAAADNTAFKRKQEKLEDSPKPKKSKKEKVKEEPSEESVKTEPDTEDTPKKEKKDKKKKKKNKSTKLHVPLPKILKTSPRLILPDFHPYRLDFCYLSVQFVRQF